MKLLIATPAYGGLVTTDYCGSLLNTFGYLSQHGIAPTLYTLEKESLIPRGRNTCAKFAIDGGFDKMLFIDADLGWRPEWVKLLLDSGKDLIGGTYPIKTYPITLNFNPIPPCPEFREHRQMDNYFEFVRKYANERGEVEVSQIPTGFMLIDMKVLAKLSHTVGTYTSFHPETGKMSQSYDFFPSGLMNGKYESEDWAFCNLAKEAGFSVWLQTQAVCSHTGSISYQLGQHEIITGQAPVIPKGNKA